MPKYIGAIGKIEDSGQKRVGKNTEFPWGVNECSKHISSFIMLLTYISNRDILHISRWYIKAWYRRSKWTKAKEGLRPNVGDSLFIYCSACKSPSMDTGHRQEVKEMTKGEASISPGTMYGTLSKMEKDGLIRFVSEAEKRKIYADYRTWTWIHRDSIKRIYQQVFFGDEYNGKRQTKIRFLPRSRLQWRAWFRL